MGVQAIRSLTPLERKEDITITTPATALAVYPGANEISVVTMLPAADVERSLEINNTLQDVLNFIRDNNVLVGAGSVAVVTTLAGGRTAIRTEALAASVVTGDLGIMIVGSERAKGSRNYFFEAHIQIIDFLRELNRLGA